jgi:hypothetical protein
MYRPLFDRCPRKFLHAGLLLIGLCGHQAVFAAEPQAPDPKTLREAVAEFAESYDITLVGDNLLGQEAPDWPPGERPPAAILQRLLHNYGYITELRSGPAGVVLPQRVIIVGASVDRIDANGAQNPMPDSIRQMAAAHATAPSALTRTLNQLALAGRADQSPAPSTQSASQPRLNGLSGAAAPGASAQTTAGTDMAALTQAARASVTGLAISLRNACAQGSRCQ